MSTLIGTDYKYAAECINRDETVGIPTETVYGLAANALSEIAVTKIFEVKNRPFFDPLIVHVKGISEIDKYATDVPILAKELAERFWPGPLTLILKKRSIIPDLVTSGGDTVALRMPNNELTLKLLNELPFPLAAPSANPFTYVSPTSAQHVFDQLNGKIPYILDGGMCEVGIESTIIRVTDQKIEILRPGGISQEEIKTHFPFCELIEFAPTHLKTIVPGQLEHHYSPFCKLFPLNEFSENIDEFDAVIFWEKENNQFNIPSIQTFYLTQNGDFGEGSRNLFALLRKLDKGSFKKVLFEWAPNTNLGVAINDRLKRASAKRQMNI